MDNKKEALTFLRGLAIAAFAVIVAIGSSAGCLIYAFQKGGEPFFIIPGLLNLASWGFVLYKMVKKLKAEGKIWN